jgi:endonuclease G
MADKREQLLKYLRGIQERDQVTTRHLEELRRSSRLESAAPFAPAVTDAALESWNKFESGRQLDATDFHHLEAVVLPNGLRPSFDIAMDSYDNLPAVWQPLNDQRSAMQPLIRGIGRLNLSGHPSLPYAGTGFVVGDQTIMTNRHVAEFFVEGAGGGASLHFTPGITASLDTKQEVASIEAVVLDITQPVIILDDWDAALLRVNSLPAGIKPLPLAATDPGASANRMAAVIGYPAMDPASDLTQQLQIFRGVFNKKRMMPGRLMGRRQVQSFGKQVNSLAHDCTTLGGNSGSAVIDVDSGLVVGLHFAGDYLIANYAVPSWELASDSRMKDQGLSFV